MKNVSLLLVGAGGYGENYCRELFENTPAGSSLVAVVDPYVDKSPWKEEIVRRQIPIFRTLEEFYAQGREVDLVVIASPIHTHYAYITSALEHQSNVLCEKPVVMDVDKLEALMRLEQESGCFVAVGYQLCFSSAVLELKRDIQQGVLGAPLRFKALRMMRRDDEYYQRNGWAGKLFCHGEAVFDSPLSNACAHQAQTMFFLLGSTLEGCCTVSSAEGKLYKARPSIENYDAASVLFRTEEDVAIHFYTAHCVDQKHVGPLGMYEFENATVLNEDNSFVVHFKDGRVQQYGKEGGEAHMYKLHHSVACVRTKERPPCTLVSSLGHTQAVLLAQGLPAYFATHAEKNARGNSPYWVIPNIKDAFLKAYESWTLPDLFL